MKAHRVLTAMLLATLFVIQGAAAQETVPDDSYGLQELLQREDVQAHIERGRPQPTGDALFDQYAHAAWDANAANAFIYEPKGKYETAAALPDSVLLEWEDEFGDDPRWWELRWFSALVRKGWMIDDSVDPVDILQEAVDSGHASPAIVQRLYCQRARDTWTLVEYSERAKRPTWDDAEMQELESLLDKFIELATDHCWGYMERGMLELSAGKDDAAQLDFERSAAASERDMVLAFPCSKVYGMMREDEIPGSKAFAGMILGLRTGTFNSAGGWFSWGTRRTSAWAAASMIEQKRFAELQSMQMAIAASYKCVYSDEFNYRYTVLPDLDMVRTCFITFPEKFNEEQRSNLWSLAIRCHGLESEGDQLYRPLLGLMYDITTNTPCRLIPHREGLTFMQW